MDSNRYHLLFFFNLPQIYNKHCSTYRYDIADLVPLLSNFETLADFALMLSELGQSSLRVVVPCVRPEFDEGLQVCKI